MRTTRQMVDFKPRARLIETIGEDLIKDEMAGVIELVKNAYDADASEVSLQFKYLTNPRKASIIIKDNGHGMAKKNLLDGWFSPATASKLERSKSPHERIMLGRKGIGRFSAMRLGEHLKLETTPNQDAPEFNRSDSGKHYTLVIDWSKFKDPRRLLQDVKGELSSQARTTHESGTKLSITKLNDPWDTRRVERLRRELKLLLSGKKIDFSVSLDLSLSGLDPQTVKNLSGEVEPYSIPSVADYEVEATIGAFGEYKLLYKRLIYADRDRQDLKTSAHGQDIRELWPKVDSDLPEFHAETKPSRRLHCGPLKLRFHVWDRDPALLVTKGEILAKGEGSLGVRAIGRLLDEISGVAIYRDGFRVRPYGDADYDWLGLGRRRVQMPASRLGPNQMFGLAEISTLENPLLEDKASREGLKENQAYSELQACIHVVIGWVEPLRYRFRQRNGLGRSAHRDTQALVDERKAAFGKVRATLHEVVHDAGDLDRVSRFITDAENASELEHERLAEQATLLQDSHALGLLARFILHEGRNLDGSLDSSLSNLERILGRLIDSSEESAIKQRDRPVLKLSLESSRNVESQFSALLDQLDPLTRPRRKRRPHVVVEEVLGRAVAVLKPDYTNAKISFESSTGQHTAVAWEADLFHAFHNLLHNSLWWAQQTSDPHRVSVSVRSISSAKSTNSRLVEITVKDSGPGVDLNSAQHIFELGYSEKPDGRGIGLFIVREAIQRSKGEVRLKNPGVSGAEFVITLEGE